MTSKTDSSGTMDYVWDQENRLYEASTRKQRIRYRYDALGRRISRYIVGGKENTKFTYDGNDVILDDNSGVITKYQNGLGIDNKLKMVTNGVSKYFLQDHLGSTTALTNSSGSVIESATYDSFGNATGNLSTRYQFTGREYDKDIGLTYYRARWYSSELGRFVSEDPIGFGGGDVNLFGYVKSQPLKYRDPRGLDDADTEAENRIKPPSINRNPWHWSHNESADNNDTISYISGEPLRNPTPALELGGNFHGVFFGGGVSVGVDRNLRTGQTCVFKKWSMRTGLGVFAGAGIKANFGEGVDKQKTGQKTDFEEYNLDIGDGLAGKLRLGEFDSFSSSGSDVGIGVGPGVGLSGGVDWGQRTNIWCSPCD
jgi:RHS repeat-associated protein